MHVFMKENCPFLICKVAFSNYVENIPNKGYCNPRLAL